VDLGGYGFLGDIKGRGGSAFFWRNGGATHFLAREKESTGNWGKFVHVRSSEG
jgi:hypothetical protein